MLNASELLKEVAPKTRRVAILSNLIIESLRKPVEAAAPRLKLDVDFITVSKPADLDVALDRIAGGRYDGILVFEDPMIWTSQSANHDLCHCASAARGLRWR